MSLIRLNHKLCSTLLKNSFRIPAAQRNTIRQRHIAAFSLNNSGRLPSPCNCNLHCKSSKINRNGSMRNFSVSSKSCNATKAAATQIWIDVPTVTVADPPTPPPVPVEEIAHTLNALGEPTLSSLGLGGYSPFGVLQTGWEFIHVTTGLPWWGTIALSTVVIRILLTPAVIIAHKNATAMANSMPRLESVHDKISEARRTKEKVLIDRFERKRFQLMREVGYQPIKNGLMPLLTAQAIATCVVSLHYMIEAPVKALENGGLYWFSDLLAQDPYYVLPLISCATFWLILRQGSDGYVVTSDPNKSKELLMLQIAPFVLFPCAIYLPAAINLFFASYNLAALVQGEIVMASTMRRILNIPQLVQHKQQTTEKSTKK